MLKRKTNILLAATILAFAILACNALWPSAEPTIAAPQTEAEVPRVSVEEAKAAFDSGAAIIVDVRSAEAYAASHVPGAINIQLEEFETNPTDLELDKEQWIITYCT